MIIRCCTLICLALAPWLFGVPISAQDASPPPAETEEDPPAEAAEREEAPASDAAKAGTKFYVIPVQGPIGQPTLFAIRTGVKAAIEGDYDYVALDMETPGGRLDSTLEIMEVLDRFPGKTLTFINDEAISAGAIIAVVTDEIYFTPKATMGSAEPVTGQGQDINESMKRKITSYLNAKMEAYTEQYAYRSDVIRAMMDPEFELEIDGEVISPEGQLLNLTATRAHQEYGDPPAPLLGSGIVEELDALLRSLSVDGDPEVFRFEASWSLKLAEFIVMLAPFLLAVAIISVYLEFQTPGFGVFGITGIICFLIAIFGHNVAGLSGNEPLLLFLLGVILLGLELFVAPGTLFFAIPGFVLMLVSLVWAMADVWPSETPDYDWNWAMFERPLQNLLGGALLGIVTILVLARFLPKTVIWDRLVLKASVGPGLASEEDGPSIPSRSGLAAGTEGVAVTDLMPGGEIEVEGRRYEACMIVGTARRGARVRVLQRSDFRYVVEEVAS